MTCASWVWYNFLLCFRNWISNQVTKITNLFSFITLRLLVRFRIVPCWYVHIVCIFCVFTGVLGIVCGISNWFFITWIYTYIRSACMQNSLLSGYLKPWYHNNLEVFPYLSPYFRLPLLGPLWGLPWWMSGFWCHWNQQRLLFKIVNGVGSVLMLVFRFNIFSQEFSCTWGNHLVLPLILVWSSDVILEFQPFNIVFWLLFSDPENVCEESFLLDSLVRYG